MSGLDIYETLNAGGVKRISGKTPSGEWEVLWETDQVERIQTARIFSPPLQVLYPGPAEPGYALSL